MKVEECRGDWALVTGASSGIGAEFSRRLAFLGFNLVMVARRQRLLDELSDDLKARYAIQTLILPIDLSRAGSADSVKLATSAAGLRIRLLVNNAAFGPWGSFEKTTAQTYEEIVQLIAATPIALCRLYISDLRSFPSAAIVNLSSPAALQPVPYKAVYSAVKTCLHNFSLALYGEWQGTGVMVQTLLPGPTATELDAKGGAYKSELGEARRSPSEIVDASLAKLDEDLPFVTTNKGTYRQRVFAGVAPIKIIIGQVKKMFVAPAGR